VTKELGRDIRVGDVVKNSLAKKIFLKGPWIAVKRRLVSAAPLKCFHASAGMVRRAISRKSRRPICSSGFSVIQRLVQEFKSSRFKWGGDIEHLNP